NERKREKPERIPLGLPWLFSAVARGGVEPPTYRFSGGRSYQLSYLAPDADGHHGGDPQRPAAPSGPDGIRTRDLHLDRVTSTPSCSTGPCLFGPAILA